MKIAVSAAGGFLGLSVVRKLREQGHWVLGIDSRPFEADASLPGRTADQDLANLLSEVDSFVHLEWSGSLLEAMTDPEGTGTRNFHAVQRLLHENIFQKKRLIFTSTSLVYGGNLSRPTQEDEDLLPRSFYGSQKRHAEDLIRAMSQHSGFDALSLRVFNLYGPGNANKNQILPKLGSSIRNGEPITLNGDGNQQRDFLHVDDAAEAIARFCRVEGQRGEVFNLGSGVATSMNDLAHEFYQLAGREPEIQYFTEGNPGPICLAADLNKTHATIGDFSPRPLSEGLRDLN